VSLFLHGDPCLYATNGVLEKAVPTGQGTLKLLGGAPARLACPDRVPAEDQAPGAGPTVEPDRPMVPFPPQRLLACRYLMPEGRLDAENGVREIDGAAAAGVVRAIEEATKHCCPPCVAPRPRHNAFVIYVVGVAGRVTLSGDDASCPLLSDGRKTALYDVNALLAGR
jgi:hypothetical protein